MQKNYLAWDIVYEDFWRKSAGRERLQFLLNFAVLAPSSHNSQPWRFRVGDAHIEILPDLRRALPVSDPDNRHLFIGLGCALENILVAADYYGLETTVEYMPENGVEIAVRVLFAGGGAKNTDARHLIFSIPQRRMNRNRYREHPSLTAFFAWASSFASEEVCVETVADQAKKERIADILMESRVRAFSHKPFRHEMAGYKRNNLTHSGVGITGNTMGFSTPFSLIAPFLIRHMNVMKVIRKSEERLLKNDTPVFVIVGTHENNPRAWILAGRALERLLLETERRGLAAAISAVPPDVAPLQKALGTKCRPQMFLRLGYAEKLPPHSPRLRAEEVVE
ncbi:MAG: hypothetical protein HYY10_04105 [Candidatus Liptonbacteria bacterium]|nr:hypothetical protein [Candidatus Liptonbacteria bacterium]